MTDQKDDLAPDYIWAMREVGSDDMDRFAKLCAMKARKPKRLPIFTYAALVSLALAAALVWRMM